jgi:hypothetical protein
MSAELRQVANGFAYRVKKYSGYDVNGYRFRTTNYDKSSQLEVSASVTGPSLSYIPSL